MNQYPSHSNMPTFVKNESNTKPVLYQHPTAKEMRTSRWAKIKADIRDFLIFIVIAIACWMLISVLLTAAFGG
ncbi:hypothetical protein [Acinetobacter sp. 197]|uniref:hypothetical protein n=1 Tax=Acinetobacter sp. 197 TaxID=3114696 RepID=UPI003A886F31